MFDTIFMLEAIPSESELQAAVSALTGIDRRAIFFSSELDPWWQHEAEIQAGLMFIAIETWVTGGEFPFGFDLTYVNPRPSPLQTGSYRLESAAQLAEHLQTGVLIEDCTGNPFRYVWVEGYNHILTVAIEAVESDMGRDLYLDYASPSIYLDPRTARTALHKALINIFDLRPSQLREGFAEPSENQPVVVYPRPRHPKAQHDTPYYQPIQYLPELTSQVSNDLDLGLQLAMELEQEVWVNLHECKPGLMMVIAANGHMRRAVVEIDGDWDAVERLRVVNYLDD